MRSPATRRSGALPSAVDVVVRWGDQVVAVQSIAVNANPHAGSGDEGQGPCDVVVPSSFLGFPRFPLWERDTQGNVHWVLHPLASMSIVSEGDVQVHVPDESMRLRPLPLPDRWERVPVRSGASVTMALDQVSFSATFAQPSRVFRARSNKRDQIVQWTIAASVMVHIAVLAIGFLLYLPEPVDELGLTEAQRSYLVTKLAPVGDAKEGGTGTRARGEEGSMGVPNEAQQFGMIGLLNSTGTIGHGAGGLGIGDGVGLGSVSTLPPGRAAGSGFGSGHGRLGGSHRPIPPKVQFGVMGLPGNARASSNKYGTPAPTPRPAATPAAPEQPAPLDPNGRYATTYRPGGGHLAGFEAAIARGALPPAARELVAEMGGSHAPWLDAPKDEALAIKATTERALLPPQGGTTHLRIALRSSADAGARRPPLAVTVLLDNSGSMKGAPLDQAKQAVRQLFRSLKPTDLLSLVTFSTQARVMMRPGAANAAQLARLDSALYDLYSEGGTNLGDGLARAYGLAKTAGRGGAIPVVLVVSDGCANAGQTNPRLLSRMALDAFQDGVQTSTFGLGPDFDPVVLGALADDGAGGYYYLRDASEIAPALSREIDQRLDPAATAVEVRVRIARDVKVLRVYGSKRLGSEEAGRVREMEIAADGQAAARTGIRKDRENDHEGGMRFFIPAFARNDSYALLVQLDVPPGVRERRVASVELRYKDLRGKKNQTREMPVGLGYANTAEASAATAEPSVVATIQAFAAGDTLLQAADLLADGQPTRARSLLAEREMILRAAADQLRDPGFRTDADLMARLRSHTLDGDTNREDLAVAMLLRTAGRSRFR